jgi:hypothetical protein
MWHGRGPFKKKLIPAFKKLRGAQGNRSQFRMDENSQFDQPEICFIPTSENTFHLHTSPQDGPFYFHHSASFHLAIQATDRFVLFLCSNNPFFRQYFPPSIIHFPLPTHPRTWAIAPTPLPMSFPNHCQSITFSLLFFPLPSSLPLSVFAHS